MDCKQVDNLLFAYLDGELKDSDIAEITEHLEKCKLCTFKLNLMGSVKKSLQEKHLATMAPSYLKDRILERIYGERERTEGGERLNPFVKRPVFAFAAAVFFLFTLMMYRVEPCNFGHLHVKNLLTGKVVCIGCEYHKKHPDEIHPCDKHGHHAALMTEDGAIWHIFPENDVKNLLDYKISEGKMIEFQGDFFEEAHLLKIKEFKFLKEKGIL